MEIFDSHTHLNSEEFLNQEEEILAQAAQLSVTAMNIVGIDRKTNDWALALAEKYENCSATIGWHPDAAGEFDNDAEEYLRVNLAEKRALAVGEIGLDYHWMEYPKWLQEAVFRHQIWIAKEFDVPFQVHTREALADTYEIIKSEGLGAAGAMMHSFSGTYEEALKFADLGMMISFSGVVTFKKATDVQEAAAKLPLDRILVETDAPYLAPSPYRGKENQPAYSRYIVEKIAELRGISSEEVAETTYQNAKRIFRL